jgi:Predicted metal-dependent hydrolase with the TIM-barrel fold
MSSGAAAQSSNVADAIYVGGDIVTIDEARPTAEALAIKNGKILFVDDVH